VLDYEELVKLWWAFNKFSTNWT